MLQPKFGRVLIEREVNEKSAGGIIIVDAKRHANHTGIIKALGETAGWVEVPEKGYIQTLEVGQKVMIGKHSGAWLDTAYGVSDEEKGTLFICQDADILAVMEN